MKAYEPDLGFIWVIVIPASLLGGWIVRVVWSHIGKHAQYGLLGVFFMLMTVTTITVFTPWSLRGYWRNRSVLSWTIYLMITPIGTSAVPATVNLSASGLPPGATYKFTPGSITPTTGQIPVYLDITVPKETTSLNSVRPPVQFAEIAVAFLVLPFTGLPRRRSKRRGAFLLLLLFVFAGMGGLLAISGCEVQSIKDRCNNGVGDCPDSSITITATSGTLTHTATATLTVLLGSKP